MTAVTSNTNSMRLNMIMSQRKLMNFVIKSIPAKSINMYSESSG